MRGAAASLSAAALCLALAPSIASCADDAPLNVPRDVGRRIAACWRPPSEGDEITLKMGFRADGTLLGRPRITYLKASGGPDGKAALANSVLAAIGACPLRFTPALGAAIAGRVFTFHFVAPRKQMKAAL